MKSLTNYLNEAKQCSKCATHKNTKKIVNLTTTKKYKAKDIKLKNTLDQFTQKFKKSHKMKIKESILESSIDDWNNNPTAFMEDLKEDIFYAISEFMQNNLDDWKMTWEEPEDMERDLETAEDWFWNEIDNYIEDLLEDIVPAGVPIDEVWEKACDLWESEITELIEGLIDETEEYANEKYF